VKRKFPSPKWMPVRIAKAAEPLPVPAQSTAPLVTGKVRSRHREVSSPSHKPALGVMAPVKPSKNPANDVKGRGERRRLPKCDSVFRPVWIPGLGFDQQGRVRVVCEVVPPVIFMW